MILANKCSLIIPIILLQEFQFEYLYSAILTLLSQGNHAPMVKSFQSTVLFMIEAICTFTTSSVDFAKYRLIPDFPSSAPHLLATSRGRHLLDHFSLVQPLPAVFEKAFRSLSTYQEL
ncbi:MAG: hypothetical protein B2I17_07260 [Thermoplasmatales archaeon B_DKE]|nr:MAG: hypothetical protein B2I17_07260 [Thermoplasmatales archaeon B_DKE]